MNYLMESNTTNYTKKKYYNFVIYLCLTITTVFNVNALVLDCEELNNCYGCTSSPLNCMYIPDTSKCVSADLYNVTAANVTKYINRSECPCINSGRDAECSFCIERSDCTYCQNYHCYTVNEHPENYICFQKCLGTGGFVTAPYVLIAIYTGVTLSFPIIYLGVWWIWRCTKFDVPFWLRLLE